MKRKKKKSKKKKKILSFIFKELIIHITLNYFKQTFQVPAELLVVSFSTAFVTLWLPIARVKEH